MVSTKTKVEQNQKNGFTIDAPKKKYYFREAEKQPSAAQWVEKIQKV